MKRLILAALVSVFVAGCAVHAGVGSHGASVGATVYLYDNDRSQHYYHDHNGNRRYMDKGWKKPN